MKKPVTPFQKKKQEIEDQLLASYNEHVSENLSSRCEIVNTLMIQYGLSSSTDVYRYMKRAKDRAASRGVTNQ